MEKLSKENELKQMVDPTIIYITKCLRQIAHELSKHSKYIQENYNITVPQLVCLREIYERGPISLSDLTKSIFLNNSTVTGIVDRLEKQGLVRRTRTSRDRRQIHIEITDAGTTFLGNAPPPIQQNFIDGLNGLNEEEVKTILWAIEKLVDLITTDEAIKTEISRQYPGRED
ncbi:MAG: MarR family transcriptional regulator [Spirochaetes bacterium]|nr:MAG: MarR family transcriptional regulator [Spirochaetota bacterium]